MNTKTEKDAKCARLMGWKPHTFTEFGGNQFKGWLHTPTGRTCTTSKPPPYATDNQLAAELLDELIRLKKENIINQFELYTTSINDEVGFCYWSESGRHDFFAPTWQEAIIYARVEIGEV